MSQRTHADRPQTQGAAPTREAARAGALPAPASGVLGMARARPEALGPRGVLHLQRALGNGAVGRLLAPARAETAGAPGLNDPRYQRLLAPARAETVQRKVRFRSFTVADDNWKTYADGLSRAHDEMEKKRRWDAETSKAVWAKMIEMIDADAVFPSVGTFASYQDFIVAAAKQLATSSQDVPDDLTDPVSPLVLKPLAKGRKRFDFSGLDEDTDLMVAIHDESSQWRSDVQDDSDLEQEFGVPFGRRRGDEKNTMDRSDVQGFSFGSFSGEIRGGRSHLTTPKGGGKGPDYADLWGQVLNASLLDGHSEGDVAVEILMLLEKGAFPGLPEMALRSLDTILGILVGSEMSRATSSVIHFAASVFHVWNGGVGFVKAFSGDGAVYLGANEGGAQLLRGVVPKGMEKQQERAKGVGETYLARFMGPKDDLEETIQKLASSISTNILAYKRERTARLLKTK